MRDVEVVHPPDLGFEEWFRRHFPSIVSAPFAPRHRRLGEWVGRLSHGVKQDPLLEIWSRGSGKSTMAEGAVAYVAATGRRRFCLYVSGTQDQATAHAQTVSAMLEQAGIERLTSKYGHSRGWSRNLIRTSNGFNLLAIGLDQAGRGIKFDDQRPDLIILDDIDDEGDTARTVEAKKRTLRQGILPMGSADVATLAIQNLIRADGVFAEIAGGRGLLSNRSYAGAERAVDGLQVEITERPDGSRGYEIVAGVATWDGQSLERCESQIAEWTLSAFLREAQHEVGMTVGTFYDPSKMGVVHEIPDGARYCRAWDRAATEGGGDWTVGVLMAAWGAAPNVVLAIVDVVRGQYASHQVNEAIHRAIERDPPGTILRLPQDPGQAGKAQAAHDRALFGHAPQLLIRIVTGSKAVRARTWQDRMNSGNAHFLDVAWPEFRGEDARLLERLEAREAFRSEHAAFREAGGHLHDDIGDACADAAVELVGGASGWDDLDEINS